MNRTASTSRRVQGVRSSNLRQSRRAIDCLLSSSTTFRHKGFAAIWLAQVPYPIGHFHDTSRGGEPPRPEIIPSRKYDCHPGEPEIKCIAGSRIDVSAAATRES